MTAETRPDSPKGFGAEVAAAAQAFSRVGAFNAVTPRDPAKRVVHGEAYGPDRMQAVDVFAPVAAAEPAPVAVFFHGGGWQTGRRQEYGFVGRALASRGFLTVVAGYRLVPQIRYPAFLEDAAGAARWAVDHAAALGGDPARLAFIGHSAGGYIAVQLGYDTRYLHGAGVEPAHVRAVVGLSGPYSFLPLRTPATLATFSAAEDLDGTQPVNHARADGPAALLVHGGRDTAVTAGQSVRMGRAIEAAGGHAEVRIHQTLTHTDTILAFSRPFRRKAPILDEVAGFLDTHLSRGAR
ncbi:alpha/beta hydrolase [Phenylobacterium montanum]|uniref:Alpha/beta hydrolase n=1 Tax=Phenylobacterium montanum TaxID=2823693 RepID=A0A975G2G0_9CAUL|nr:alpha/beta hydrolase [Caulobacter sp. S6]QUD89908.1 alpha/beta hydrolase [Caulobacter sp. S6]